MIIQYSGVPTYSLDQISLTCCTKWPAFHQNYFAIKINVPFCKFGHNCHPGIASG